MARKLTERLEVRISSADRAQAQAAGRRLGMTLSGFLRMAAKERADLEAVIRRHDEEGRDDL
jgi:antitoxin component of RelBE/YafQ-DinJ toxin-antitoxin module